MANSAAAKAEALGNGATFTYDGVKYTIAPATEWDLEALDAFEAQKVATCVRLIIGDAQWQKFRAKPRKVSDLNDFFAAMQEAIGVQGN